MTRNTFSSTFGEITALSDQLVFQLNNQLHV